MSDDTAFTMRSKARSLLRQLQEATIIQLKEEQAKKLINLIKIKVRLNKDATDVKGTDISK